MVLGGDVLLLGAIRLFLLRPGADTAAAFACALTLADAFTQLSHMPERDALPFCAPACMALFCCMWGDLRPSGRACACPAGPRRPPPTPPSW